MKKRSDEDFIHPSETVYLAFGGRTSVMVLVLSEIADAFVDRRNNLTQLDKKKRFTVRDGMTRYSKK